MSVKLNGKILSPVSWNVTVIEIVPSEALTLAAMILPPELYSSQKHQIQLQATDETSQGNLLRIYFSDAKQSDRQDSKMNGKGE